MAESYAKSNYPSLYAKLDKMRQNAANRPLTMKEINILLSMFFNNKPMFESIELFYNEEYGNALKNNTPSADLDKMEKFRAATDEEINLLYSDLHAREDKIEMHGAST